MSIAQLRKELSKLSPQEKLVLAGHLVREAEDSSELSAEQVAELDRRYAEAIAHPEKLLTVEEAERRVRR